MNSSPSIISLLTTSRFTKLKIDDYETPVGLHKTNDAFQLVTESEVNNDQQWIRKVNSLYEQVEPFLKQDELSLFRGMRRDKNLCMRDIAPKFARSAEFVKEFDRNACELFRNERKIPTEIISSLKKLGKTMKSLMDFQTFYQEIQNNHKRTGQKTLNKDQAAVFKFYCTSLLNTSLMVNYQTVISIFEELQLACHPDKSHAESELYPCFLGKRRLITSVISEEQWNSTQLGSNISHVHQARAEPARPQQAWGATGTTKTKINMSSLRLFRPMEQSIQDENGRTILRPLRDFINDKDSQSMPTVDLQTVASMLELKLSWLVDSIRNFVEFLYDEVTSEEVFNNIEATRKKIKRKYEIHLQALASSISIKTASMDNLAKSCLEYLTPLQEALEKFAAIDETKIKQYRDIAEIARHLARIRKEPINRGDRWFQRYDRFEVRRTYLGRFRSKINCESLDTALVGDYAHRKEILGLLDHFPSVLLPEWHNVDILDNLSSKSFKTSKETNK